MRLASFHSPVFLISLLLLNSCDVSREEISGAYTVKGLKNTLDTLKLTPNGTYTRTLYTQSGQRLLFRNTDKWDLKNNEILLYNFLPEVDEKHAPDEVLGLGSMLCFLPVKSHFGKIVISVPYAEEAAYEKL